MINKSPAFQLFASDFLTGTAHFKADEVGAYIRLMCHQWDRGGLDIDDFESLSGVPIDKLKRVIKKFNLCEDGLYRNKRIEITRQDQLNFREKQTINGQKGGRPKNPTETQPLFKNNPTDNPNHNPKKPLQSSTSTSTSSSTTTLPSTTTTKENKATKKSSRGFVLLRERFLKIVSDRGMEYYFTAKDGGQLKLIQTKLIALCKLKNSMGGEPTDEKIADAFEYLLTHLTIKFVIDNFTIPIINSKWNEIVNDVKGNKNGATREQKLSQTLASINDKIDEQYANQQNGVTGN